jgi:beta-glucosidase-like glycosyl hydrolase/CubicO group peptidase (beta-lactamase class C family)
MQKIFLSFFILIWSVSVVAQDRDQLARRWADSVLASLNDEQRIAQLMIIRAHSNLGTDHIMKVSALIEKYNVGGLCFFQGGPVRQAMLTNQYQRIAKTPLLITIDAEWGLGMRLDSVQSLPRQLMLGAVQDPQIAYRYGQILGLQCRRMGIQVDYAPVIDVNNNPSNPVINDRSLGEDRHKVALFGTQIVKGLQDAGVMACVKHFPGHGDTETDSHHDLPVINKSRKQLDSLELYPFRTLFQNQVASVMVGHLFIPAIDSSSNRPTSLSYSNVTQLMRQELNYMGLSFTDALEMKGVQKFFPGAEANVEALAAGNDLLCLPEDVPAAIQAIKKAIRKKRLSNELIDARVHRVLVAKYMYGLTSQKPIDTTNLIRDLNAPIANLTTEIASGSITLLRNEAQLLPLNQHTLSFMSGVLKKELRVAYVAIGLDSASLIANRMQKEFNADVYYFNYRQDAGNVLSQSEMIKRCYDYIVIGVHNYSRRPAKNFGISDPAFAFVDQLLKAPNTTMLLFGNPYAARFFCSARHLIACYEDHPLIQQAAMEVLSGIKNPIGKLPVTVCDEFPYGTGLSYPPSVFLSKTILPDSLFMTVDSIIHAAIDQQAMPGCVVLAVKDGKVVFEKAYGYTTYEKEQPVTVESVYDLASITKIAATTLAVMKLYEAGKLDLKKRIGDYLAWTKRSRKARLTIEELLLHEGGLKPWIPFHLELIDTIHKTFLPGMFSDISRDGYQVQVTDRLFLRNDWQQNMYKKILKTETTDRGKYVYSDQDFIFLGKIVEQLTGTSLDNYVRATFYEPMHLCSTGFLPLQTLSLQQIVPTEKDDLFRKQLLRGFVHDQTAALFGGISGHAGLFSNAYELAALMQMLMNGGTFGNIRFLKPETIALFTSYQSLSSRRGLGFDKPEKDNATRKDPYPSRKVSLSAFGHTGFTGTCTWADPDNGLVFVFLSNRVYPDMNNRRLLSLNVRGKVQDALYEILTKQSK